MNWRVREAFWTALIIAWGIEMSLWIRYVMRLFYGVVVGLIGVLL